MKLCIPTRILDQHVAVLGKTGAGKSSALRHIVEHLLDHKKRVCIIDPKGDWYGLKLDGQKPGYPVIGFGDFKNEKATDVQINAQSGKHVAELIATGNRPCIIGFRGWMTAHMVRFWIDFAPTLFNANSGELYLVGDEFHNFAPKGKILDPEAGKCLHWSNRLMSEGRGYGLVCLIASQRPQKVHNDTLTCCETLVAMRVIHKADRDAVQDWIEGCGDMTKGKEVLNALAGMERGEAYVWSPEIGFGPERLKFPMFETFDSFAPPQLQKKVSDSGWSSVNLDEVKDKLAVVIEEAKANDPAELKREISKLRRELGAKPEATQVKEVPLLTKHQESLVENISEVLGIVQRELANANDRFDLAQKLHAELKSGLKPVPPPARQPSKAFHVEPSRIAQKRIASAAPSRNGNLPKCEAAILRVLANFPHGKLKREVGVIAGYKHSGGGFNNAVGALRSLGYVQPGEPLRITREGLAAHGEVEPLPSGDELFFYWSTHPDLGRAEREILRVLFEFGGKELTKEAIAEKTQSDRGEPYDPAGGGFNNAIGRLRTYELITGRGTIRAAREFFE